MKNNIHKLNGFIYVTSEEEIKYDDYISDRYFVWQWKDNRSLLGTKKVILTNDFYLTNVQQLTPEEEAYCKTVDSVEVRKEKYSERFDTDKSPIGNYETWGNRYKLQLPKQKEMKATEIKAKELVEEFTFKCIECDYEQNAIQCAIISQQREVDLLKRLNSAFYSSYLYLSLQEAKEVLTILKEM